MDRFFLVTFAVAFAAVTGRWIYMTRHRNQLNLLDKVARRLDLAIDPANASAVARRLVRRERAASVGYLLALASSLPVELHLMHHYLASSTPPPFSPLFVMLPWVFVMLGILVGRSVCAVLDAHRAARGPRLARAQVPALTDYVRRSEVVGIRVAVLAVGPALAVAFLADPGPMRHHLNPWLVWAGVAVPITFWAVAELGARLLLRLGQPAMTLTDLAWDDALRSLELRQLYATAVTPSIFLIEFCCVGLGPPAALQPLFLFGSLGFIIALGFLGKPASHFRRRLWPSPADALHPVTWRST